MTEEQMHKVTVAWIKAHSTKNGASEAQKIERFALAIRNGGAQ